MNISTFITVYSLTTLSGSFPTDQVEYYCKSHPYYTANEEKCVKEQKMFHYGWKGMILSKNQRENSLIYGIRKNAYGEVVGIDYKLVVDRAKYIKRTGELE